MCVLNVAIIDTTPGQSTSNPFCPPEGFSGTAEDYTNLCRSRYSEDVMFGQRMVVIARYAARPSSQVQTPAQVIGPYAAQAQMIIDALINAQICSGKSAA